MELFGDKGRYREIQGRYLPARHEEQSLHRLVQVDAFDLAHVGGDEGLDRGLRAL